MNVMDMLGIKMPKIPGLNLPGGGSPGAKPAPKESSKRTDPYAGFRFRIEIDSLISGGFSEVSGLEMSTEVESVKEGGVNHFEHKLVKFSKFTDITLKRGLSEKEALWKWCLDVAQGKIKRKNLSVILLDETFKKELKRWDYFEAYPIKWTGPSLNAMGNATAIESVVLTHHGLIDVK